MSDEQVVSNPDVTVKSEIVENPPEPKQVETKEKENVLSNDESAKIRQATEHKISKKFERDLVEKNARIAELERMIGEATNNPDSGFISDPYIGMRSKNMSVEEYQQKLAELHKNQLQQQQEQAFLEPVQQRAAIAAQKIPDFNNTLTSAAQNGLLTREIVLLAGQEDGGLEILYDLAKSNSPKLLELQRLPQHEQAKELWRLAWLKSNPPQKAVTSADHPLTPVDGSSDVPKTDYESMNFKDGYKEFLKKRRG